MTWEEEQEGGSANEGAVKGVHDEVQYEQNGW